MSTRRRRRPANEIARILSPVSSPTSREITAKPRRIAATVRDVGSYITRSQRAPNGRSWLLDVDVFDETKRPFERGRLVGYVYRSGPNPHLGWTPGINGRMIRAGMGRLAPGRWRHRQMLVSFQREAAQARRGIFGARCRGSVAPPRPAPRVTRPPARPPVVDPAAHRRLRQPVLQARRRQPRGHRRQRSPRALHPRGRWARRPAQRLRQQ